MDACIHAAIDIYILVDQSRGDNNRMMHTAASQTVSSLVNDLRIEREGEGTEREGGREGTEKIGRAHV